MTQGCIFFYNSPHLVCGGVGGGGGESKGFRAREENQRRVKKNGRTGGKEGKNFGGLSYFILSWAREGRGGGKILLDTGRCGKESTRSKSRM